MSYVNESNFDTVVPETMRDEFWTRVRGALRDVLNSDPRLADKYRKMIEKGTTREQILVYHDHPLNIAADLAGNRDVGEEQFGKYDELFPDEIARHTRCGRRLPRWRFLRTR